MRPTSATLRNPTHLKKMGNGLYAAAYLQEDGTVLKISRGQDGTMDFIEWCWLRLKKFGKGSVEMAGLPEVECFGRGLVHDKLYGDLVDGWWAVMPKYQTAEQRTSGKLQHGFWGPYVFSAAIENVLQTIERELGVKADDIHSGNVMWDPRRRQWVVTDPICDEAQGTAPQAPQKPRFKKVAQWKRSPLQRLAFA